MDIGGAESHIYDLCLEYKRQGHSVLVLSSGGIYTDMLKAHGISHVCIPLDSRRASDMHLCAEVIARLTEKHAPDVVHSHSRIPSFICARLKGLFKRTGCVFITTAHLKQSGSALLSLASEWGEHTIAVSHDVAEQLACEGWVSAPSITIINNGVDTEHFSPSQGLRAATRERLGISPDATVICTASRSSESRAKIALELSENAHSILKGGEHIVICVSGSVDLEPDMTDKITENASRANDALGYRAVIVIVGECDIHPYLCASDIFVGVSRSAMEAMACALPVIIAGNEGVGQIFSEQSRAALIESNLTARGYSGDISDVSRSIEALRDKALREELGQLSLEYAKAHLTRRAMADATISLYERLIKEKGKPVLFFIGHYGAGNCGDDASLSVIKEELSDEYEIKYLCKYKKYADEGAVLRSDMAEILKTARDSHAVVLGTGNLIQDMTSTRSLSYYGALFSVCARLSRGCAVFANGLGPLTSERSKRACAQILSLADYISMRERLSYKYASRLGVKGRVHLGADVVFLTKKDENAKTPVLDGEYCMIFPRAGQGEYSTTAMRELIISERSRGVTPVLVPMDATLDCDICRELSASGAVIADGMRADALLSLIEGAKYTVCSRLHAAVLSLLAHTPCISLDYDGRASTLSAHSGSCTFTLDGLEPHRRELIMAASIVCGEYNENKYKKSADRLRALAKKDIQRLRAWLRSY